MTLPRRAVELVRYRELLRELVVRDLKVRYKGSVLGFLWSMGNPLLMMAVFYVVFTRMMSNQAQYGDYALYVLIGLLAWNWTTGSVIGAVGSIVNNANLIKKVYFPREVLPISTTLSAMANFILSLPILFLFVFFSPVTVGADLALLPLIMAIQLVFLVGLSLLLSAVNVFFRDTGVIVDVALTAWFFLTPIFYRPEDIFGSEVGRWVYRVNPMAGLVTFYREIIMYEGSPSLGALARTSLQALVVFAIGYLFFQWAARRFGEEV